MKMYLNIKVIKKYKGQHYTTSHTRKLFIKKTGNKWAGAIAQWVRVGRTFVLHVAHLIRFNPQHPMFMVVR